MDIAPPDPSLVDKGPMSIILRICDTLAYKKPRENWNLVRPRLRYAHVLALTS